MNKIEKLKKVIQEARDLYYNGKTSHISDDTYDAYLEELRALDPNDPLLKDDNIGAKTSSLLTKVKHKMFMGSLDNSMSNEDFTAFDKRVAGGPYLVNPKVDGASVALYYKDGILEKAVTRGDGNIGDDITDNVLKFNNLPKKAKNFTGSVRGEAILFNKEWEQIDPDNLGNPRNIGSGIIQRLDGENADLMRILAFDIYPDNQTLKTEEDKVNLLNKLGFETPESKICKDAKEVIEEHDRLDKTRNKLKYGIDGLVVKINDLSVQDGLGMSGKRPKGQTAFKFVAEKINTVLLDLEWTVGHTGAQVPTAILKPVRLEGTTVKRALLCNIEEIERLDIAIGDEVEICKRGQIIPKIIRVISRPSNRQEIKEPSKCVVCGAKTRRRTIGIDGVGAVTECSSDDCSAKKLGRIKNFISKIDVLGLGDTIIQALVESGLVNSIPDLYKIQEEELANIVVGSQVGEKRASEIMKEINKKRNLSIDLFLGSLGINHLGRRRVEIIRKNVFNKTGYDGFNTVEAWLNGELTKYKEEAGVPGVGDTIQKSIDSSKDIIKELLKEVKITEEVKEDVIVGKLTGMVFCLTGAMSRKRSEIANEIKSLGGQTVDDVSNKDVVLVQADHSSVSSKSKKANKVGAKIISEEDLNKML